MQMRSKWNKRSAGTAFLFPEMHLCAACMRACVFVLVEGGKQNFTEPCWTRPHISAASELD